MKEKEGLDSKNEGLSQKGDKAKQSLRKKSHFWVRVRAFYIWGEKKRKGEENKRREGRRKKEEGRREEKQIQVWNFVLEPLLYGNCMESTYVCIMYGLLVWKSVWKLCVRILVWKFGTSPLFRTLVRMLVWKFYWKILV